MRSRSPRSNHSPRSQASLLLRSLAVAASLTLLLLGLASTCLAGALTPEDTGWQRIKDALADELTVCQEHCGGEEACLQRCEDVYEHRLEQERLRLGQKPSEIMQSAVPASPTAEDKCPVCGMFVAKFPDWVAQISWADGSTVYFDGAKDMFRYLADLPKYASGHTMDQLAGLWVTDYYNLEPLDAREAFYVIGSDVFGPMGHELIPLASQADAQEFLTDHGPTDNPQGGGAGMARILTFKEVTPAVLESLK